MAQTERPVVRKKTRILKAGKLNNPKRITGFTLVELMVVITIISLMLFFAIPLFKIPANFGNKNTDTAKLIQLIQSLKRKSIGQNQDYFLHIATDSNRVWITDTSMDEPDDQDKTDPGENLEILHIELLGKPRSSGKETIIKFSKNGYSDMAIIHMDTGETPISLKVQPFLMEIETMAGHISFDDCI
jgi:prepilin-type N-terminal cleavage/methylation domain-containing protein